MFTPRSPNDTAGSLFPLCPPLTGCASLLTCCHPWANRKASGLLRLFLFAVRVRHCENKAEQLDTKRHAGSDAVRNHLPEAQLRRYTHLAPFVLPDQNRCRNLAVDLSIPRGSPAFPNTRFATRTRAVSLGRSRAAARDRHRARLARRSFAPAATRPSSIGCFLERR